MNVPKLFRFSTEKKNVYYSNYSKNKNVLLNKIKKYILYRT